MHTRLTLNPSPRGDGLCEEPNFTICFLLVKIHAGHVCKKLCSLQNPAYLQSSIFCRMKKLLIALFIFSVIGLNAQQWQHGRLKVTADGHYLQYEDGAPFFWLGDTGWELFHRLTLEETAEYLENRRQKGFNVIQAVLLAEFDGLTKPDRYGQVPLNNLDPTQPNEKYFVRVDSIIKMALNKNLFIGLLPTWGDKVTKLWGAGPVVFNEANAYTYGLFLGKRYKAYPNIIWIMGGDRPAKNDSNDWRPIWRAMVKGIKEGTANEAIFTYHPSGGVYSTSQFLPNEAWMDINMMQSGHGGGHDVTVWDMVARDRNITPTKPTLDGEPNYEDHPVNPWPTWDPKNGYYDDYDVRKQTYRSVFAGACGVTYGHHSVWQFASAREEPVNHPKIKTWREAINRPGAYQVGYLRRLVESRNMLSRVPDSSIVIEGQGLKGEHIEAFRAADGSYGMVYLPIGKTITIHTDFIKTVKLKTTWFNPQTGGWQSGGVEKNNGQLTIATPTLGVGNDWVLVLDATKK
jgi:hypothetical protein